MFWRKWVIWSSVGVGTGLFLMCNILQNSALGLVSRSVFTSKIDCIIYSLIGCIFSHSFMSPSGFLFSSIDHYFSVFISVLKVILITFRSPILAISAHFDCFARLVWYNLGGGFISEPLDSKNLADKNNGYWGQSYKKGYGYKWHIHRPNWHSFGSSWIEEFIVLGKKTLLSS